MSGAAATGEKHRLSKPTSRRQETLNTAQISSRIWDRRTERLSLREVRKFLSRPVARAPICVGNTVWGEYKWFHDDIVSVLCELCIVRVPLWVCSLVAAMKHSCENAFFFWIVLSMVFLFIVRGLECEEELVLKLMKIRCYHPCLACLTVYNHKGKLKCNSQLLDIDKLMCSQHSTLHQ